MFKQSPVRSHRSKGLKVKHVLQICVLLAVCIWLIYQVKHSHEKRREFETKDEKVVGTVQRDGEIHRFGRKDIPRITEIVTDGEKHEDEDEKEGVEEENKHEDDELEREDVRLVDTEEEAGDDEIDEHEPEKIETEIEHEEEEVDEDKEREGKEDAVEENHTESEENEAAIEEGHVEGEENDDTGKKVHNESVEKEDGDKEDQVEVEVDSDDQEHVAGRTNTREAQEVLYHADDASSEVAHDVQSIPEVENATTGRSKKIWGNQVNFEQEHESKGASDNSEKLTKAELQPREDVKNGTSNAEIVKSSNQRSTQGTTVVDDLIKPEVNLTKHDEADKLVKAEGNLTKLDDTDKLIKPNDVDSSHQNSTLPEMTNNSSGADGEHSATSNGTKTTLDSNLSQISTIKLHVDEEPNLPGNKTVKLKLATDDKKLSEAEAADTNKAENVNTDTGESLSSHDMSLASAHATNVGALEAVKDSFVGSENQGEKAGSENQHDPIDASDTNTVTQEETESSKNVDTLSEIKTEVQKTEDAVAE